VTNGAQSRSITAGVIGAALMCIAWKASETRTPPPSSSNDVATTFADAKAWAAQKAGRIITPIAATGSMLPLFGSNSYVGLEPVTAAELTKGDIATWYDPARKVHVIHRVVDVTRAGVFFDGVNNSRSDGWLTSWVPWHVQHLGAAVCSSAWRLWR
jgi:hypothetical protein